VHEAYITYDVKISEILIFSFSVGRKQALKNKEITLYLPKTASNI